MYSKIKYTAPKTEVINLGSIEMICTSGVDPDRSYDDDGNGTFAKGNNVGFMDSPTSNFDAVGKTGDNSWPQQKSPWDD